MNAGNRRFSVELLLEIIYAVGLPDYECQELELRRYFSPYRYSVQHNCRTEMKKCQHKSISGRAECHVTHQAGSARNQPIGARMTSDAPRHFWIRPPGADAACSRSRRRLVCGERRGRRARIGQSPTISINSQWPVCGVEREPNEIVTVVNAPTTWASRLRAGLNLRSRRASRHTRSFINTTATTAIHSLNEKAFLS